MHSSRLFAAVSLAIVSLAAGCRRAPIAQSLPKLIVLGVDGMDPSFVERHWQQLPNLKALRDSGYFGRLRTTTPPESPVAWSTFITGLAPDQHGIYDFVHRDPATLTLLSSMSKMDDARFAVPLGPYLFPLSSSHASSLRHGTPFWRTLSEHGVPATVLRIPVNYPPEPAGQSLSGMGTPDLLGTLGTYTLFTDDPVEVARSLPGGQIVITQISNGRARLTLEGPANPLRKDHALTAADMIVDIDPVNDVARIKLGDEAVVLRQGEWSAWLTTEFNLIPHISSVRGMVRVFAKQLHPGLELYVSPINFDPAAPALPISFPTHWSAGIASEIGRYSTLGIPEDTSALRQEVLSLPEFRQQAELVFGEESKLLDFSLRHFNGGFLFFYFSSIDQNSHVLWGKHEDELLKVYREVDACVGSVRRQQPQAELIIISDHGFTTFDRAVNLNAWLNQRGFLKLRAAPGPDAGLASLDWPSTEAYAVGLNGLYLNLAGREKFGIVRPGQQADAIIATLRDQLLAWRDPANGKAVVDAVAITHPSPINKNSAPDLIVGYAAGYRASWQTGLGQVPVELIEDNNDAWIGDHCVSAAIVPGVLFSSRKIRPNSPGLADVTSFILNRFLEPSPTKSLW